MTFRKQYKELLLSKKNKFLYDKVKLICNPKTDIRIFWNEIKRHCNGRRNNPNENISSDQWLNYFKILFSTDQKFHAVPQLTDDQVIYIDALDKKITKRDVLEALRELKPNKSPGKDGILPEMLKLLNDTAVDYLTNFFNYIFENGLFPQEWAKAVIVPIFKKGNHNIVDNYRGVSLLSTVSKCYTSILNKRLYEWLEQNHKIGESQAGFRKGHSTIDHIFTLNAVIQKCLSKNGGKCYVAFVDFNKAFDSVQHSKLFESLQKAHASTTFIVALQAMYSCMCSCVRITCDFT